MTHPFNPALSYEALYSKSQVYITRALRAKDDKLNDEYYLWASLSLELLGKSTLADLHPCLVADPTHANSLFLAAGRQLSTDIKTISAKTLFERLKHISKDFDSRTQKRCEQMALRRNSELHSGESPFSGINAENWEKEFWRTTQIILKAQKRSLEDWLGEKESKDPLDILSRYKNIIQSAVSKQIEDRKKDHKKQKKISYIQDYEDYEHILNNNTEGYGLEKCLSCGQKGLLGGVIWSEEVTEEEPDWESGILYEHVEITYTSEEFYCPTCELHLIDRLEVLAAGLREEFSEIDTRERDFEADYGND